MAKLLLGLLALFVAIAALLTWWLLPVLNPRFLGTWALACGALLATGLVLALVLGARGDKSFLRSRAGMLALSTPLGAVLLFALVLVVAFFSSAPMLHAGRYAALIGDMTPRAADGVEAALPQLALERAPLVTEAVARRAAETKLGGEDPALGSVVQVGGLTRQVVAGRLVWVGFLEHRGFFPWLRMRTTPGYVTVDATDAQNVQVVRSLGGAPLRLRYLASAAFWDFLPRFAYFQGHTGDGFGAATDQVDDQGRPFAVIPLLGKAIGMGGDVVTGVLTVDVQTGEATRYSRDDAPAWIDRIEPGELVFERLEDWGMYHSGGWLNPSQIGRLQTSTWELDLVSSDDGHSYWVTGLTSVGRDTSLTGLVLVDTRSGEPARFPLSGVIEEQSVAIVEQAYREKGYRASNPTPFLVEGTPSYVMALTDDAGSTKGYGLVAMQNKETFATSATLAGALQAYQVRLARNRRDGSVAEAAQRTPLQGKVERFGTVIRDGATYFYLTVDTAPELLLSGMALLSEEFAVTRVGDPVRLEYQPGIAGAAGEIRSFDNESIGPR
ncbi:MAG: hypothetical protein IT483_09890 [Gammaproteobacteria bacterium]|nr:hypothetical protein [Gammaproteobacteria bacterium]